MLTGDGGGRRAGDCYVDLVSSLVRRLANAQITELTSVTPNSFRASEGAKGGNENLVSRTEIRANHAQNELYFPRIELTGYLSEEQLQRSFDKAGMVVLPCLPGPGLSAGGPPTRTLVDGRPVIASRVGVFAKEISDNVMALLVPFGDAEAFARIYAIAAGVKSDQATANPARATVCDA